MDCRLYNADESKPAPRSAIGGDLGLSSVVGVGGLALLLLLLFLVLAVFVFVGLILLLDRFRVAVRLVGTLVLLALLGRNALLGGVLLRGLLRLVERLIPALQSTRERESENAGF